MGDGDSSDEEIISKPKKVRTKAPKVSPEDVAIRDLEERLRRMEMGTPPAEVLAAAPVQEPVGGHQQPQWGAYGRPRQQGRGYQQYPNPQQYPNTQQASGRLNFAGGQQPGFTCYNCGKPGNISRYCPEASQGRTQSVNPIIVFPGPTGPKRARWIAYPPDGLPAGYYPVDDEPQSLSQPASSNNSWGGAPTNLPAATSRITEVTDVAAVETVSSADREAHSSRDLVKYVNRK